MKITYSKSADAVAIDLIDEIKPGASAKTYTCDPLEVDGQIHLDFDKDGRLISIEVLDASTKLPQELLEKTEIIG